MVTSAESKKLFEVTAAARTEELFNRRKLIKNYLTEHEPEFARLYKLQQEVRSPKFLTPDLPLIPFLLNTGMES